MEFIKKNAPQYKANLHCHSTISDGKLTPAQLKEAYKSAGYSVLCITDHEYPYNHSAMTEKDFLMLTGYEAYIRKFENCVGEVYTPEIHLNLIAKEPSNIAYVCWNDACCKYESDPAKREAFKKVGSQETRRYTAEYINKFVKTAIDNGYLCTHNHPAWSLEDWTQIEQYEGFFSMEMFNYSANLINGIEYNARLYDHLLRKGKRIFCHSADDNHNGRPFGDPACDSFGGFTMILAENLDYSSVISALEKGNFYSSMGPVIESLKIEPTKLSIECEGAKQVIVHLGGRKTLKAFGNKENPLTEASFDITDDYKYIRVTVVDFEGKCADTRAFFPDEIG